MRDYYIVQNCLTRGHLIVQKDAIEPVRFSNETTFVSAGEYLVYVPPTEHDRTLPAVVYLHGSGERGTNVDVVATHGPLKEISNGLHLESIVIAPLCPENRLWTPFRVFSALSHAVSHYPIDDERISITGISMGGTGAVWAAMERPDLFSCLITVAGNCEDYNAAALGDLPVWIIHGRDDTVIPVDRAMRFVTALENAGGNVRFDILEDTGHDAWSSAYSWPHLYDWAMEHSAMSRQSSIQGS